MCPDISAPAMGAASVRLNPFDIRACVRTHVAQHGQARSEGLNPFDIRACVRTASFIMSKTTPAVLIPLISGHVSGQCKEDKCRVDQCLNPFDIRACVRTLSRERHSVVKNRLNPFDIRACVRTLTRHGERIHFIRLNPFDIRACVRTNRRSTARKRLQS